MPKVVRTHLFGRRVSWKPGFGFLRRRRRRFRAQTRIGWDYKTRRPRRMTYRRVRRKVAKLPYPEKKYVYLAQTVLGIGYAPTPVSIQPLQNIVQGSGSNGVRIGRKIKIFSWNIRIRVNKHVDSTTDFDRYRMFVVQQRSPTTNNLAYLPSNLVTNAGMIEGLWNRPENVDYKIIWDSGPQMVTENRPLRDWHLTFPGPKFAPVTWHNDSTIAGNWDPRDFTDGWFALYLWTDAPVNLPQYAQVSRLKYWDN